MQNTKLIAIIYAFLLGAVTAFAQNNTLSIPDASVAQGRSIELPIHMDNTSDVVAVQFNLYVPDGITVKPETAKLTERSDGHSVSMKRMDKNRYMALVFSGENKSFLGRTGKLLSVEMDASSELREDAELKFVLNDVVITAKDGSNIATGSHAGKIIVTKTADLMVTDVATIAKSAMPNEKLTVTWQVQNTGLQTTRSGWQEQLFLESPNGVSKLIGTLYYDDVLEAGGIVSRSAEIKLPEVLGLHGEAKIRVKVTPNSDTGESTWMLANNQSVSTSTLQIGRMISLSPTKVFVEEKTQNVRLQLLRSGNTHEEETFSLSKPSDSRVQIPEKVTIPKRQSGTYFYAKIIPNGEIDVDTLSTFIISGTGYNEISDSIVLEDDTYPSLQISSNKDSVQEGESMVMTVSTKKVLTNDIKVTLTSDHSSRFEIPESIVIPAGKTNVDVVIKAKEDDIPDVEQVVTFTAVAPRHISQSLLIMLADNDVPNLEMELLPNAISEADGPLAVTAKLRRLDNKDKKITIKLYDDSDNAVYYGKSTIVMDKGVEEAILNLGPIDNGVVDGERTVNISAAVYIASCSCNASAGNSGGIVTVPMTIYDNDGPTLSLSVSSSLLKEGGEIQAEVSRNTNPDNDLIVTIGGNQVSSLVYPQKVTIPAGKKSANFTVKAEADDISGNDYTAMLTADAQGYSKGSTWFAVSDQTLPDARISAFDVSVTEVEVGSALQTNITLENSGSFPLPELTMVSIYAGGDESPLTTIYLQSALGAGERIQLTKEITLPNKIGVFNLYAMANESKKVKELIYTNNSSQIIPVKTVSPFKATVQVEKDSYNQGDSIMISGVLAGNTIANNEIEIYVINDGHRHTINAKTDANGKFTTRYLPFAGQIGHFSVGACCKGEELKDEMASFDVYGLKRTPGKAITCEALLGDIYKDIFTVINPGLSLTGLKAEVVSKPEYVNVDVVCPNEISAGQSADVQFSITADTVSQGNEWEHIVLRISSEQGAILNTTLYYYCRNKLGKIESSVNRINTTMTKGAFRDYPFVIRNTGMGETGKIKIEVPDWMKLVTPSEMTSILPDSSETVILRLAPTEDMQLNVPVSGQIGINCANGLGMALPYYIEPVSESTGTLIIDVCDEYTYNTAEKPHVQGAEVKVSHPTTNELIASGKTDENGLFTVTLPEGYYAVSVNAEKHESYRNNILVDPGKDNKVTVNISYEAITIQWEVEEIEIEDRYEVVTTVQYETNVPMPVVKISLPERIDGDNMTVGEKTMIYMGLTNEGLINAEDVELVMPMDLSEFTFEALSHTEPFLLEPKHSVIVPIVITRIADNSQLKSRKNSIANDMVNSYTNCMVAMGAAYKHRCGKDIKTNKAAERLSMKLCAYSATMQAIAGLFSGGPGGPGGPGGLGGFSSSYSNNGISNIIDICDTCDAQRVEKLIDTFINFTPLSNINEGMNEAIQAAQNHEDVGPGKIIKLIGRKIRDGIKGEIIDGITNGGGQIVDLIWGIYEIATVCEGKDDENKNNPALVRLRPKISKHNWDDEFKNAAQIYIKQLNAMDTLLLYSYGDRIWLDFGDREKMAFLDYVDQFSEGYIPTDSELIEHKPSSVTLEQVRDYINYINGNDSSFPTINDIYGQMDVIRQINEEAVLNGYSSMTDAFENVYLNYRKHYEDMSSSSVCASITLQFKQTMTMTRQAFRGSLIVYNGNEETPMSNVKLHLKVSNNTTGQAATSHEFQINVESLDGFVGKLDLSDGWTLDANETGTAKILFIPTKYAAPDNPVEWSFGGTLSYIDPYTQLEVTRELYPVTLTVKPSPVLDLTYFMQRDVIGDDPLTTVVEPCEEAEFALLINNVGNGEATKVQMVTDQPKIIENEKGLLIDFELMSSRLNGGEKTLALGGSVGTDFGNIPAKSQVYAQWMIKSSLLGHFTEYDVKATHLTSYGNPDLSLLGEVTIHELIRSLDVDAASGKMVGFMANDQVDAGDMPDILYLSNGEVKEVNEVEYAEIQKTSDRTYTLTIKPEKAGWIYGNIKDPTYGRSKIQSVIRKHDGKVISLRNFWQTDRTLRDGKEPLYENRMHFADEFTNESEETYIITFEPTPDIFLEVEKFEGVPTDVSFTPLDSLKVHLNKEVDPKTFTTDDITVTVQGKKQNASLVGISTNDNKTFTLDLSKINKSSDNGYYTLTVQTTDIKDTEGYKGRNGKSTNWIMFREGFVKLLTAAYPLNSGSVTKETGAGAQKVKVKMTDNNEEKAIYGSTVILTAIPSEGYEFSNWTLNGEIISEEERLECQAINDMDVKANFVLKKYEVKIESNTIGGEISGDNPGIYSYGDTLTLMACPSEDFVFKSWSVNGEMSGKDKILKLKVTEAFTIEANFAQEIFEERLALYKGWNWISNYLDSPLSVHEFTYADRLLGQYEENIYDTELGMVGNIDSIMPGAGYKIFSSLSSMFIFKSKIHNIEENPITLEKGWNWISYPYYEDRLLSEVITNAEEGDYMVAQNGFSLFENGYWEGSVNHFAPGGGYLYKSVSKKTLDFDFTKVSSNSRKMSKEYTPNILESYVDIRKYPNTMNIVAQLSLCDSNMPNENYRIYAMAGNECRGVGKFIGNHFYITVYGNSNENIVFIVENLLDGKNSLAKETIAFTSDVIGDRNSPFVLNIGQVADNISSVTSSMEGITIYSVNGSIVVQDANLDKIKQLQSGVYIINGQKFVIK